LKRERRSKIDLFDGVRASDFIDRTPFRVSAVVSIVVRGSRRFTDAEDNGTALVGFFRLLYMYAFDRENAFDRLCKKI